MVESNIVSVCTDFFLAGFFRVIFNFFQAVHLKLYGKQLCHICHRPGKRIIQAGGSNQKQDIGKQGRISIYHKTVTHNNHRCQTEPQEHLSSCQQARCRHFRRNLCLFRSIHLCIQFAEIIFLLVAGFYILYSFQTFLNTFGQFQSGVHVLFAKFFLAFPRQNYDCKGNRSYPKKSQTHLPVDD